MTVCNLFMMVAADKTKSTPMVEHATGIVQDKALIVVDHETTRGLTRGASMELTRWTSMKQGDACVLAWKVFSWSCKIRKRSRMFGSYKYKARRRVLYLFLPCKKACQIDTARRLNAWSFSSLQEIGWGPPERKMAYKVKLGRKSNLRCKRIGLLYFILVCFLSKVVCVREGFRLGSSYYL